MLGELESSSYVCSQCFFTIIIEIRYEGNLLDENQFYQAINEGFKNEEFRNLIIWLSNEISELGKLDEKVKIDF